MTTALTTGDGQTARATRTVVLRAAPSRILRGHWIGRVVGPWAHGPQMAQRLRSGLRFTTVDGRLVARVMA